MSFGEGCGTGVTGALERVEPGLIENAGEKRFARDSEDGGLLERGCRRGSSVGGHAAQKTGRGGGGERARDPVKPGATGIVAEVTGEMRQVLRVQCAKVEGELPQRRLDVGGEPSNGRILVCLRKVKPIAARSSGI